MTTIYNTHAFESFLCELMTFTTISQEYPAATDEQLRESCKKLSCDIADTNIQAASYDDDLKQGSVFCSSLFVDVAKHLYRKEVFEKRNYSKEIALARTLHNYLGNRYYFSLDKNAIQQLLLIGSSFHHQDTTGMEKAFPALRQSAESALFLQALGLEVHLDWEGFSLTDQSEDKLFKLLEQKIDTFSGNLMLSYLGNECMNNRYFYVEEFSRYMISRRPYDSQRKLLPAQERAIPLNLLFQLSAKHLRQIPPRQSNADINKAGSEIVAIAQAYLDIFEYEGRSAMEYSMMRIEQFPRYLYEELKYDKLCIPQQYGKRYVLMMLDELIQPFFSDAHAEFSFREYRQVAEYILNSCYFGGERLTIDVLHAKLKISRHRLQAILDVVSRRRGETNSKYTSCMETTNAAEKPLIRFPKGVYLCMPMMFCGIGFYLSAYNLIQPNHENIDRLIGKRIEVMVRKELDAKGFKYKHGKYEAKNGLAEGECDIVLNTSRLCFIEIKKRESYREFDKPDDIEMLETLSRGMVSAQNQCFHHEKYLREVGVLNLKADNTMYRIAVNDCNLPALKVSACLSEYSFLTSALFSHNLVSVLLTGEFKTYDPSKASKLSKLAKHAEKLRNESYMDPATGKIDLLKNSNYSLFLSVQQLLTVIWLSESEDDIYDYLKSLNYIGNRSLDPNYIIMIKHYKKQIAPSSEQNIEDAVIDMLDRTNRAAMFIDSV